jgi:hypothetical protein
MGLLTDIFVATPEDALKYESLAPGELPPGRFEVVNFKGLTDLEFGTLWAILAGEAFDMDRHALEALTPGGETWLFGFPSAFVERLAGLGAADTTSAAAAWAATEELQWDPSETEEVLVELVRLARRSKSTSKGLYFWGSL